MRRTKANRSVVANPAVTRFSGGIHEQNVYMGSPSQLGREYKMHGSKNIVTDNVRYKNGSTLKPSVGLRAYMNKAFQRDGDLEQGGHSLMRQNPYADTTSPVRNVNPQVHELNSYRIVRVLLYNYVGSAVY